MMRIKRDMKKHDSCEVQMGGFEVEQNLKNIGKTLDCMLNTKQL